VGATAGSSSSVNRLGRSPLTKLTKTLDLSTKNVHKPCLSTFFVSNNKLAGSRIAMYSALYYPHTVVGNSEVLRSALLLWDRLEFIVPWSDYDLKSKDNDSSVDEALELIGVAKSPSWSEQQEAHKLVEELVTSSLPNDFLLDDIPSDDEYLIYPQKFLPETWSILSDVKLAIPDSEGLYEDWVLSKNLGLSMMSILADVCAGTQKRTVTDKTHAYQLLNQSISHIHGGEFGKSPDDVERLVTVTMDVVDPNQFSLKELIALRKREGKESGDSLKQLRHNYLDTIDVASKKMAACTSESDLEEILRVFREQMQIDIGNLRDALKLKRDNAILSKEVGVGLLAVAGMALTPWTFPSGLLAIGALVKQSRNYKADRRSVMKDHAMSWIFELSQQNKPLQSI